MVLALADIHRDASERSAKINTLVGELAAEHIARMKYEHILTVPPPAGVSILGLVWHVTKGGTVTWEDFSELSKQCSRHSFHTRWLGKKVEANMVYSLQIVAAGDGTFILSGTACYKK